jgi:arylsulfatase A-like enzyme
MKYIYLGLFTFVLSANGFASTPQKPNIVIIIADDMGYGDTKTFWPASKIHTPSIERLCATGLKLTNYHVDPLCTPTRSAFLSGQGTENFGKGGGPEGGVMDEVKLLPQFLKEQGYVTGGFGKWHMGSGTGDHPLDRGFDQWIGYHGGSMPYFKSYLDERNSTLKKPRTYVYEGHDPYTKEWSHTTDLWADEANRFIEENKSKPFYLHLAFNAVHGPLFYKEGSQNSARPDWLKKIAERGVSNPQDQEYIAVVEHMDERIGSVLECLEKNSLTNNTLVFFFSDNGAITRTYHYSEPAAGDNGPYRAGKATLYEGGIRVPAVLSWPGIIPAGSESDKLTCHWDFFPTVYQILGLEIPSSNGPLPWRGNGLLEHFKSGGKSPLPARSYVNGIGPNRSVISDSWKLINVETVIGKGDRVEQPTNGPVLFNLSEDPGEKNNVSKQHPDVVERLGADMKAASKKSSAKTKPSEE